MATYLIYGANAGVPVTGLTPSFATFATSIGGALVGPGITQVNPATAAGFYTFTYVAAQDVVVVLDMDPGAVVGLPAADRYLYALITPRDADPTLISRNSAPTGAAFAELDAGNGTRAVTIHVASDAPGVVPGCAVTVRGPGGLPYFASLIADANGDAVFGLDDGTYEVLLSLAGYSFAGLPLTLTVTADQTTTYTGSVITVTPPTSPALCRVFADMVDFAGAAVQNVRITAENMYQSPIAPPQIDTTIAGLGAGPQTYTINLVPVGITVPLTDAVIVLTLTSGDNEYECTITTPSTGAVFTTTKAVVGIVLNAPGSSVVGATGVVTLAFSAQIDMTPGTPNWIVEVGSPVAIGVGSQVYVTDVNGHVEIDLVQGAVFKLSIGETPIAKQITVPSTATANLLTLLGAPQDSFTVV